LRPDVGQQAVKTGTRGSSSETPGSSDSCQAIGAGGGSRTRTSRDHEQPDGARLLGLTRFFGGDYRCSPTSLTSSRNTRNRPCSWRDLGGAGTMACSRGLHVSVSDITLSEGGFASSGTAPLPRV